MAHIYVYSPSGAVRDKAAFKRGVQRLKALGHSVELDRSALASVQRFAGDEKERIAAIARAAASGADVALISRGGYGLSRILADLPYKAIEKSIARAMLWVGMSDFTAFQAAVWAKTGAVTWAGPALCADFGVGDEAEGHDGAPDAIMQDCFGDLVQGVNEGAGWLMRGKAKPTLPSQPSRLHGPLWGGNLVMLSSLIGTPYFPSIEKGILWFEDVAEHPYQIERLLLQWLHAGLLQRQRAIVLGQFSGYSLSAHDRGFSLQTVVERLRSQLKIPVLMGLPFGHVPTKVCLPFGRSATLMIDGADALLYWG